MDKDSDAVVTDLKKIYQAGTVLEAEQALEGFVLKLGVINIRLSSSSGD